MWKIRQHIFGNPTVNHDEIYRAFPPSTSQKMTGSFYSLSADLLNEKITTKRIQDPYAFVLSRIYPVPDTEQQDGKAAVSSRLVGNRYSASKACFCRSPYAETQHPAKQKRHKMCLFCLVCQAFSLSIFDCFRRILFPKQD